MKGKVLSFITAILFGATVVFTPIVASAAAATGEKTEVTKPAKKTVKKKATKKKTTKKKTTKKKATKKKAAPKVEEKL